VLITGATGFLGSALAWRLLHGGVRLRLLVRSAAKAGRLTSQGAEAVVGDLTNAEAVNAALRDVTIVYHLAGRLLIPGVHGDEYRRTHVEGTQKMLAACERTPSVKRFVHCSTTGVLGVTGYRPADEDAPMRPTNVYEQTKAQAELAVCAAWSRGFPAVIARPGLVYGPGDLHLLPFFTAVLKRRFRPIGRRAVWLHPIYIDDLTEALVRCGDSPSAGGQCFHLAGPSPVSLTDLAQAIADAGGTRCPRGHFPLPVARAAAALSDLLPGQLKRRAPLTRRRLDFLTHSRVYDVTKAQRQLGFTAATGLSSGMAKAISWYRSEGYLAPDSSVGHLSEDRAVAGVGL
jgi:nucleoside-diphosphate-sugar epimerase